MINSFLLIGQSNMAGRGHLDEVDPIVNNDILMFRSNKWMIAKEPIHTDKPAIAGVGLGMSFAETLQKKYNKQIGLIPCALGGSSLDEWEKGEKLYSETVAITLEAIKDSRLKGILWHQGEQDSKTLEASKSYKMRFNSFIKSIVSDIGADGIPVILGELGEFLVKYEFSKYSNIVNAQLLDITKQDSKFSLVSSKDLSDNGDFLHFNARSLREFGIRYADAWEECGKRLGTILE